MKFTFLESISPIITEKIQIRITSVTVLFLNDFLITFNMFLGHTDCVLMVLIHCNYTCIGIQLKNTIL